MKHYKAPDGSVWAYEEDGSQDHIIPDNFAPMTAAEVAAHRAPTKDQLIVLTKAEAQRRIFARYPQLKQINMIARFDELRAIEAGKYRDATGALQPARVLTADEVAEIASFSAAWSWVKSVRAASNLIEADIASLLVTTISAVESSTRWPT